jgi:hypothetical protein
MDTVARAYWPTTLPLLQRLALILRWIRRLVSSRIDPCEIFICIRLVLRLFRSETTPVDSPGSDSEKCQHEQRHRRRDGVGASFQVREVQPTDKFLDAVAKPRRLFVRKSPNQVSSPNLPWRNVDGLKSGLDVMQWKVGRFLCNY